MGSVTTETLLLWLRERPEYYEYVQVLPDVQQVRAAARNMGEWKSNLAAVSFWPEAYRAVQGHLGSLVSETQ